MWRYDRKAGIWSLDGPDPIVLPDCYAGNGVYRNDPAAEGVKDHGPLPGGVYTIGELEAQHGTLGRDVFRLIPDDETRARIIALGRGPDSFYCHGRNPTRPMDSSCGCIVADHGARIIIAHSPIKQVQVI